MGEVSIVLVRGLIAFCALLIFSRIIGKTQISQLTFFEYVSGITIGSIAASLTTDLSIRPWPTFVGLTTWVVLTLATQVIALKNRWMSKMIDGEPVVVVQNGQILERNMGRARMRLSELNSMLREKGIFDIKQVEFAVLEPRGELAVLPKSQHRPVTPQDLNIPTQYEGLGVELVVDGEVMEQNLQRMKLDRAWLMDRLREHGISSPADVVLAVMDTQGVVYVDKRSDWVPSANDMSDYPGPN